MNYTDRTFNIQIYGKTNVLQIIGGNIVNTLEQFIILRGMDIYTIDIIQHRIYIFRANY